MFFIYGCVLFLFTVINPVFFTAQAEAATVIDEIRFILSKKALIPPQFHELLALNDKNLDAGLKAIDPYARYVPKSELASWSSESPMLGVELFQYKSDWWIKPDAGGPAAKAGIPEVGRLLAIDGKYVVGNNMAGITAQLDEALKRKEVVLNISGSHDRKGKDYSIKPGIFNPASITWYRAEGYTVFTIRDFITRNTAPKLYALYKTLVRPNTRVVIDLRGCAGGDLYESLEIAGMFVKENLPLVATYDRKGILKTYKSPHGEKLQYPNYILIDHRTASSAEILAGILKYYHLSLLIGEESYGKFLSQTIFPLSNGGELWLTTIRISLPDKESRVNVGIKPDIFCKDVSVYTIHEIMNVISRTRSTMP